MWTDEAVAALVSAINGLEETATTIAAVAPDRDMPYLEGAQAKTVDAAIDDVDNAIQSLREGLGL